MRILSSIRGVGGRFCLAEREGLLIVTLFLFALRARHKWLVKNLHRADALSVQIFPNPVSGSHHLLPPCKNTLLRGRFCMAEREGFEPSIRLHAYTLSRRAPSATRTPLHEGAIINYNIELCNKTNKNLR